MAGGYSGRAVGAPRAARRAARPRPALSSGLFWLPHLGDWMHDGQPSMHSQAAIASRVAVSHARAAWKPRSANPAPPGWPS